MNKDEQIKDEKSSINVEDKIPPNKEVIDQNPPKGEPTRKIVIEFNKSSINITEAQVSSNFELQAILENILRKITTS